MPFNLIYCIFIKLTCHFVCKCNIILRMKLFDKKVNSFGSLGQPILHWPENTGLMVIFYMILVLTFDVLINCYCVLFIYNKVEFDPFCSIISKQLLMSEITALCCYTFIFLQPKKERKPSKVLSNYDICTDSFIFFFLFSIIIIIWNNEL